jgi:hypothetical protein
MLLLKVSSARRNFYGTFVKEDPSIKLLYQRRLEQILMHSACSLDVNAEWQTLNNTLQQAANEALGKRNKREHKRCFFF